MRISNKINIIDIFAGPGGLNEGFSSFAKNSSNPFRVALSIEKDPIASKTLKLRNFYRQFDGKLPDEYYEFCLNGAWDEVEKLYEKYPEKHEKASQEAWHFELHEKNHREVKKRITESLDGSDEWVLIGGPPCQAYSLAGRSRMKGTSPDFENDHRHFLYREYLKIIADHSPAVFVMENVKGILSSRIGEEFIFPQIINDLQNPGNGKSNYKYKIYSFVTSEEYNDNGDKFIIKAEKYGVPQARHRVILLGIRSDVDVKPGNLKESDKKQTVKIAIKDLPRRYSKLSRQEHSDEKWRSVIEKTISQKKFPMELRTDNFLKRMENAFKKLEKNYSKSSPHKGGKPSDFVLENLHRGYKGEPLVLNHITRNHMDSDFQRYFFASCYAEAFDISPKLRDFPKFLLPEHKNINKETGEAIFADRFRVQLWNSPSTTITSHISKDGHYFIHPDPSQCRSLTVREAARLQTFPDDYFFMGPRTEQFRQVGNAVPPLLARQLAEIVYDIFKKWNPGKYG